MYHPTKRITKKTPKTFSELSKKELTSAKRKKAKYGCDFNNYIVHFDNYIHNKQVSHTFEDRTKNVIFSFKNRLMHIFFHPVHRKRSFLWTKTKFFNFPSFSYVCLFFWGHYKSFKHLEHYKITIYYSCVN